MGGSSSRTQVTQMPTIRSIPLVKAMEIEAVSGNASTSNAEMPRATKSLVSEGLFFARRPPAWYPSVRQNSNGKDCGPHVERSPIERRHQLGSHQFHRHQGAAFDNKYEK